MSLRALPVVPDWSDRAQVIEFMVDDARLIGSTVHPFDEAQVRAFVARDFDRSGDYVSGMNHAAAGEPAAKDEGAAARHSRDY